MRVLPVAKRKSRRAGTPGHFLRKVCKKAKETWDTANSAFSGTLQGWVRACSYHCKLENSCFFEKHCFFYKTRSVGTSWAPASQGRSHEATFYASCPRLLLLVHFAHFLSFFVLSRCSSLRGDPRTSFLHFFRKRFRTRACTDLQCTFAQKCFLQLKTSAFKRTYKVRGMGPPPGTRFCMYSHHI